MIINNYIPFNNPLRSVVGSSLPSVPISVHRVSVDPAEASFRGNVSGLAGARYERHICSSFSPNSVIKSTRGLRFLLLGKIPLLIHMKNCLRKTTILGRVGKKSLRN